MSSAAAVEHALRARALLAGAEELERRLADATPEQRLELAASGAIGRVNADLRWTAELAIANALTAIALQLADAAGRASAGCNWPTP